MNLLTLTIKDKEVRANHDRVQIKAIYWRMKIVLVIYLLTVIPVKFIQIGALPSFK